MDVFKLHVTDIHGIELTRKNFEDHTLKDKKWFIKEEGEQRYFAICPACDNTIQIIRLYSDTQKPYGKHYLVRRRERLGVYSVENYECCPYAEKNRNQKPNKEARRKESELTEKIRRLLIEQFDRVIYVLAKQLSWQFSQKLATEMLWDYIAARAWQYEAATLQNIPWIFAYFAISKPLFGQRCRLIPLQQAISEHYSDAVWDNDRLSSRGKFVSPRFCFLHHRREVKEHHLEERITFSTNTVNQHVIYTQELLVDGPYFTHLVGLPEEKSHRDWRWVDLARSVFAEAGFED